MILGIIVGMPVFFEVGLVLMMPIVAEAARRTVTRRSWPPCRCWPGFPSTIACCLRTPRRCWRRCSITPTWGAPFCGGWWWPARRRDRGAGAGLVLIRRWDGASRNRREEPAARRACFSADREDSERLIEDSGFGRELPFRCAAPAGARAPRPAVLLPDGVDLSGQLGRSLAAPGSWPNHILHFIGTPDIALIIAALVALMTLGRHPNRPHHGVERLRQLTTDSFAPIANAMVILAAAGGLSGILRDSGAAQATVGLALGAHMPPLVLAWMLAAIVRVSMGSATVAMAVASGVLAPMAGHIGVRPELLVLATGTGSLIFSN